MFIHTNINSREEAMALVVRSEEAFAASIDRALEAVIPENVPSAEPGCKIITLSGPTCSGKTTTANKLIKRITEVGFHAVVMSIDDFFLDRLRTNDINGEMPDYESVKAIDLEELGLCVKGLREGKPTLIPHYDFVTGKRDSYAEYYPTDRDIFIFEGIQAVYPEVVRFFGEDYKSIFIHVDEDVNLDAVSLTRHEIRLCRRIIRDYRFRNAHPEFTLYLWNNVRLNEEKSIYPNAGGCDVYINSFLPYELFLLAKNALPILDTVPDDSPYRDEAEALSEKLRHFANPWFEEEMIPVHSVFREFIG